MSRQFNSISGFSVASLRRVQRHPLMSATLVLALSADVAGSGSALHLASSGSSTHFLVISTIGLEMPPLLLGSVLGLQGGSAPGASFSTPSQGLMQ